MSIGNYKHGHKPKYGKASPEYVAWCGMVSRCENARQQDYAAYGGRGIRVCKEWRSDFLAFLFDMGVRPSRKHSLDRVNTNGDYSPSNCRWATAKEQANNRRTTRRVLLLGKTKTLLELATEYGLSQSLVQLRFKRGWPIERIVTQPIRTIRK